MSTVSSNPNFLDPNQLLSMIINVLQQNIVAVFFGFVLIIYLLITSYRKQSNPRIRNIIY